MTLSSDQNDVKIMSVFLSPVCSISHSIKHSNEEDKEEAVRRSDHLLSRVAPATSQPPRYGRTSEGNKGRDILTPALAQLHNLSSPYPCLVYHLQRRLYTDIASCYDLFLGYPHRYKHQSNTPAHTSRSSRVSARSTLLLSTNTKVPASPQVRVIFRVIVRTILSAICDN
jgi:hypothetical protein